MDKVAVFGRAKEGRMANDLKCILPAEPLTVNADPCTHKDQAPSAQSAAIGLHKETSTKRAQKLHSTGCIVQHRLQGQKVVHTQSQEGLPSVRAHNSEILHSTWKNGVQRRFVVPEAEHRQKDKAAPGSTSCLRHTAVKAQSPRQPQAGR